MPEFKTFTIEVTRVSAYSIQARDAQHALELVASVAAGAESVVVYDDQGNVEIESGR